jgi:NTE family protein
MRFIYVCMLALMFCATNVLAQRVGLVLSGGGAQGMVHIGVIKALEENNIPIDYITGTSMGALVGSYYASGHSIDELIANFNSEYFVNTSTGAIAPKDKYYFKQNAKTPSWVDLNWSPALGAQKYVPTNVISPYVIDLDMMKQYTTVSSAANYNFDSLYIPFRCVAADVETKQQIIFRGGNLGLAVRASMSYPMYLKPVNFEGHLLFDGGMYNNFPSDIMHTDFAPDVMLGSTVADNPKTPDEDNVFSQLKSMLMYNSNYKVDFTKGIMIDMKLSDAGLFEFGRAEEIIDYGYRSTMLQMDSIKAMISRRVTMAERNALRAKFTTKKLPFVIDNVDIENTNVQTAKYIKKILHINKDSTVISLAEFEKQYYRLIADQKIRHIFPIASLNTNTGKYNVNLRIAKQYPFNVELGGNLSSQPISTGYVALNYQHLKRVSTQVNGNFYFGKLYTAGQLFARIDFPTYTPFALTAKINTSKYDFYRSSNIFIKNEKPSFLVLNENNSELGLITPAGNTGIYGATIGYATQSNQYYQEPEFSKSDTADVSNFNFWHTNLYYERSSLNRKQFASSGTLFSLKATYVDGEERNKPGNKYRTVGDINSILGVYRKYHSWAQFKMVYDTYLKQRGKFRFGVYAEAVARINTRYLFTNDTTYQTLSKQYFSNYTATQIMAPSFAPLPQANTLFLTNFRANQYVAGGIKTLTKLPFNIDLRLEGYLFQPVYTFQKDLLNKTYNSKPFEYRKVMATSTLVYNSIIGPVSLALNYYDNLEFKETNFSLLFSVGYLIFNKKALD